MRRATLYAASLLTLATASPTLAGSLNPYPQTPEERAAAAMGVPNVANLQGCVPWCRRDLNPCDPPIFKRADGRCAFPN